MPYWHWFDVFESIVTAVAGRPHWGKVYRLAAETLRDLYPQFDDFRRIRSSVDPVCIFGNPYLERVLGG